MEYYDEGQSTKIMSEFSYFYDMLRIWICSQIESERNILLTRIQTRILPELTFKKSL